MKLRCPSDIGSVACRDGERVVPVDPGPQLVRMESLPVPTSLVGAVLFFGLLAMIAWLLIRETLRIVLKPALVVAAIALVAVWAGVLDETVIGRSLTWLGDQLVVGLSLAAEWATEAWEAVGAGAPGADGNG